MTRIFAVLGVVLVLVGGGLWLARPRPPAPLPAAASAAQDDATAAANEPLEAIPGLPDGYTPVPYLTEEPQRSFEKAEEVLQPDTDYVAVLQTNRGPITIDLDEDEAPLTVNNFVFLALHHYYDDVPFHRVLKDFMAQTGDPTGTGTGGPGYAFADEIAADLHFDQRGVVAMANAGPNTNGSQFFITFAATAWLDGSYNIFGRLIDGDDVLSAITLIDPNTPSAVARMDDTVASLAEQGVTLPGEPEESVSDALEAALGTLPVPGQSVTVAGMRLAVGSANGEPAVGFFPHPDTLESVLIASRPKS